MHSRSSLFSGIAIALFSLIFYSGTLAQIDRGSLNPVAPGGTTNFRFAEPNELTIVVGLLGEVRLPGRYEISRTINLLDLIALAGGFTPEANRSDVTITRFIQGGTKLERHELKLDLENPTRVIDNYMVLQQGDFVEVGRASTLTFDRVLQYVTTGIVFVTAYVTISRAYK
jgi:hypothetical protein